jgi:hypothetical protein
MRKIKMTDKALTEALSKAPDWKSARRRAMRAMVEPIVEGPDYLPGIDGIVEIKGRKFAYQIKTAPKNPSFAQLKSYADVNFRGPAGPMSSSFPWVVRWEEEGPAALAKLAAPAVYVIRRERRFRTVMARDSWIQLVSEKPGFIRFTGFDEPEGDPS